MTRKFPRMMKIMMKLVGIKVRTISVVVQEVGGTQKSGGSISDGKADGLGNRIDEKVVDWDDDES